MLHIAKYRKRAGLTQAGLSVLLGVSQASVAQWERGTREPSVAMLKRIAQVLGVTVDALISEESC